jgi:CBS domain-containing protein
MANNGEGKPGSAQGPLRVEDAMGPVVLVRSDMPLRAVARVLLDRAVASAVVVDAAGTVRGIVTEQQLTLSQQYLRRASLQVPQLDGQSVAPADDVEAACVVARTLTAAVIMEKRLTTANFGERLCDVVQRMMQREAEYALVWRDGVAVGMLGRRDLLRLVADSAAPVTDTLSPSMTGSELKPAIAPPTGAFRWSFWK